MSSKRGRKRNDNLPPNRARDVQRAFRARRAAHLLALEERVTDLELENARLRKMVGWPPDERPALGKGPTGKDKPKSLDQNAITAVDFFTTRGSSSPGEDSSSNRTGSLSPTATASAASARHMPVMDEETWANALTMEPEPDFGVVESPYQPAPLSAPIAQKPFYPSYDHSGAFHPSSLPAHSSQRHSVHSSTPFTQPPPPTADSYTHSQSHVASNDRYSDRPMLDRQVSASYTPPFGTRGDPRDEPRQSYSYSQTTYSTPDPNMQSESPPLASITPAQQQAQGHPRQGNPITSNPASYLPHRRSFPESYTLGQAVPHLPHPASHQPALRIPEYPRAHDMSSQQPYRVAYGPDGRMNTMP